MLRWNFLELSKKLLIQIISSTLLRWDYRYKPMKEKIKFLYNFISGNTTYFAAGLSFFTIFSLLPILALLVVIISNMPIFEDDLSLLILYIFDIINPAQSSQVADFIGQFLSNTNKLGSIGIVYLLVTFTLFFNNYEYIINNIYEVPKRPIYRLFFLYIGFFVLIPVMFATFVVTSTFLKEYVVAEVISFVFIWILMFIIFIASPNTKVLPKAALVGSLVTLLSLAFTKKMFVYYVLYNTSYKTIYGSFSVVLFFFLWIYVSWSVYLYGMKFTKLINSYYSKKNLEDKNK